MNLRITLSVGIVALIMTWFIAICYADNPIQPYIRVSPLVKDQYAYIYMTAFPSTFTNHASVQFSIDLLEKASVVQLFSFTRSKSGESSYYTLKATSKKYLYTYNELFLSDPNDQTEDINEAHVCIIIQLDNIIDLTHKYYMNNIVFTSIDQHGVTHTVPFEKPIELTTYNKASELFTLNISNIKNISSNDNSNDIIGYFNFSIHQYPIETTTFKIDTLALGQETSINNIFIMVKDNTQYCTVTPDNNPDLDYIIKPELDNSYETIIFTRYNDKNIPIPYTGIILSFNCHGTIKIQGQWLTHTTLFQLSAIQNDNNGNNNVLGINIHSTGPDLFQQSRNLLLLIGLITGGSILAVLLFSLLIYLFCCKRPKNRYKPYTPLLE